MARRRMVPNFRRDQAPPNYNLLYSGYNVVVSLMRIREFNSLQDAFFYCKPLSLSARASPLRVLGFVLAMKV